MARRQSVRTTLLFAIAGTLVWVLVTKWVDDGGWREALLIAPLFFAMIFFTMLATNRISVMLQNRVEARRIEKDIAEGRRGPAEVAPTSDRIEHNVRRRSRQRAERRRR